MAKMLPAAFFFFMVVTDGKAMTDGEAASEGETVTDIETAVSGSESVKLTATC